MQKVGKRCQTPQVQDIPEDQSVRVCVSVCVCMFIHMFLQVSLTVCVSESLLCLLWHPGLCLSVCHGKRVNVVWCVCVCVF